jgi:hypothetical protein
MVRSGALRLGAVVLMLGANSVQGQVLSAFDPGAVSSFAGVFPSLPRNWSDLPIQFKISEGAGFNSNVLNTPARNGAAANTSFLVAAPVATFESISNYQASTKMYVRGQQLFADGSFGFNHYLNHANLNTLHNAADVGLNWILTSKCSGRLIASEQKSEAEPGQQVGVNVINSVTALSVNETANCGVTGNFAGILNSGTTSSTNSAPADTVNNFQNAFVAAGMTYTVAETNRLQVLATMSSFNFPNRVILANTGLRNKFTEDQINVSYSKTFNPNLSMIASIGAVGTRNGEFNLDFPTGIVPQYSLSMNWSVTPKVSLVASVSHVVTPPTSIVANLQVSENANVGVTYQFTPKVSFSASVSATRNAAGFTPTTAALTALNQAFGLNQKTYSVLANVSYALTPFLGATLSYQFTTRGQSGLETNTNVALLTVNYAPY